MKVYTSVEWIGKRRSQEIVSLLSFSWLSILTLRINSRMDWMSRENSYKIPLLILLHEHLSYSYISLPFSYFIVLLLHDRFYSLKIYSVSEEMLMIKRWPKEWNGTGDLFWEWTKDYDKVVFCGNKNSEPGFVDFTNKTLFYFLISHLHHFY